MQDDQSPADKPHDPTPRKLEEARKKGDIVRSADLNTAVMYGGILLAAGLLGPFLATEIGGLFQSMWARAPEMAALLLAPGGQAIAGGLLSIPTRAVLMVIAVPGVLILLLLMAQRGVLFTPSKIEPKLSRISLVSNAQQKFGAQGLFQFAKSAVKLAVVGLLLGLYLLARAEQIIMALYADPAQIFAALGRMTFEFLVVVTLLAFLIGAIDWLWEWAQHQQKHRMSRQEIMDETKSSEGDPMMKQQRRQRAQRIAMTQMMGDVPDADVVIVNPTHYAVALSWDRGNGGVPICVAKGVDEIARKIREVASEAGVPIFSDPPTARQLHAAIEIGQPIAPDHFKAVAAAIRFADLMRDKARPHP